jgi:hypothetical protein
VATDVQRHWATSNRCDTSLAIARTKVRATAAAVHLQNGCGEARDLPIATAYCLNCGLVPAHFAMATGTEVHQPSTCDCASVTLEREHYSQQLGGFWYLDPLRTDGCGSPVAQLGSAKALSQVLLAKVRSLHSAKLN